MELLNYTNYIRYFMNRYFLFAYIRCRISLGISAMLNNDLYQCNSSNKR